MPIHVRDYGRTCIMYSIDIIIHVYTIYNLQLLGNSCLILSFLVMKTCYFEASRLSGM